MRFDKFKPHNVFCFKFYDLLRHQNLTNDMYLND